MLFGMLIIYLLGVCLIFIVGLFADDVSHGRSTATAWRAFGALLWPVAIPATVAMAILARRRSQRTGENDRS